MFMKYFVSSHFYIVKVSYTGFYIFLSLIRNIDCGGYLLSEVILRCTHNQWFEQKKKIHFSSSEIFKFTTD